MTTFALPDDTRVSQVHLRVRDLTRTLAFYANAVGLRVIQRQGATATVSATGGPPALLVFTEAPDAPERPRRSTGLYHTAIRFPTRRDLAHVLLRVNRHGYAIDGASDHQISEAIYLSDPDGNGVELYVDQPRSRWPRQGSKLAITPPRPLDLAGLMAAVGTERPPTEAPPDTDIGHIHLHVGDLDAAERFYHDYVGLEVMMRLPGATFFAAGGYHHHIGANIWAGSSPPPDGSLGLVAYRMEVPVPDVLYCLRERAPLAGFVAATATSEDGADLLRVRDPAGHWLELQATRAEASTRTIALPGAHGDG